MKEGDFWKYLISALKQGRCPQLSVVKKTDNQGTECFSKFIGSHSLLPNNHARIPTDIIKEIAGLLFDKTCKSSTKEAILVLLAHHPLKTALRVLETYNKDPDAGLKMFARLALDECLMWNE